MISCIPAACTPSPGEEISGASDKQKVHTLLREECIQIRLVQALAYFLNADDQPLIEAAATALAEVVRGSEEAKLICFRYNVLDLLLALIDGHETTERACAACLLALDRMVAHNDLNACYVHHPVIYIPLYRSTNSIMNTNIISSVTSSPQMNTYTFI